MSDSIKPEDNSDIEPIEIPRFDSQIPSYLLEGKSEAEQFILNEVSKMGEFIKFAAPVMIDVNKQVRDTNGRLKIVEAWKAVFSSWYGFAGAILSVVGGITGIVAIVELVLKIIGRIQ